MNRHTRRSIKQKWFAAVLAVVFCFTLTSAVQAKGEPASKVEICHVPPGDPDNAHTIVVTMKAAESHLKNHPGDTLGACQTDCRIYPTICEDSDLCTKDICLDDGSCESKVSVHESA